MPSRLRGGADGGSIYMTQTGVVMRNASLELG